MAAALIELCKRKSVKLGTVESCTGGLIAATLTDISGSSEVFEGGIVTYSNDMKRRSVGVDSVTLDVHGAVSKETASEMALGGVNALHVDVSVAVTGIAGPTGGSEEKPVGLVYIAVADKSGSSEVHRYVFDGDRKAIREQTVAESIKLLHSYVERNF